MASELHEGHLALLLPQESLHHEVAAQVAGIDGLLQHQRDLHETLLGQLSRLGELQEFVATCATTLVGVPHPPRLTLQRSLEAASRLGPGFFLSSGSEAWTAGELLALFQHMQPLSLQMATSLVKPGVTSAGAIYEVGVQGEVMTDAPLFHIEYTPGRVRKKRRRGPDASRAGR